MLTWAIHGMVYLGSALMVYNVYSYIRFAKRLKEKKNWEKERATLNFPIVLLVMFLVGYLVVGIFGQPDLVMSGILFGGSIFVYVIFRLIQRIANRFEENEKLEAELLTAEESGRIKTRFLASVSHEMRTPMNAIIGLATLALQSPSLEPDTKERLTKIRLSAQHMMGLITNVLMMNRVVSNSLTLEEAPFSLSGMLNEVNVIAKNQCEEKGLTYHSSVEGQMDDTFSGDEDKLKQALQSLLDNAVKFTPAGGEVTFTAEQTGSVENKRTLRFTIRDTGIGIDREAIPNLFTAFAQEDSAAGYGGSGLGLATAKSIAEKMDGDIAVASEKNAGSAFTVTVTLTAAEQQELPEAGNHEEVSLEGRHILIVEDIELNAEIVADLLDLEGATTDWAENGQVAVEKFSQNPPNTYDAILMDLRMPVMDGLAATRIIRALDRPDAKTVPILALSANAFEEDVQHSLEAGMNAHLAKPADPDHLYGAIREQIAQRKKNENGREKAPTPKASGWSL